MIGVTQVAESEINLTVNQLASNDRRSDSSLGRTNTLGLRSFKSNKKVVLTRMEGNIAESLHGGRR